MRSNRRDFLRTVSAGSLLALPAHAAARNVTVYKESGRFAGWPANHGIWSWGNEIVVGFEIGVFKDNESGHDIDFSQPAEHVLGRSLDGGESWKLERPAGLKPPPGTKIASVPTASDGKPPTDCPGGVEFTHPDFALTTRMESHQYGPSRFCYSYDRGHTWEGPFHLPSFGQPGIMARTDYLVQGKHDLLAFVTAAKPGRREGRVICVRTQDGAKSWNLVSFVGPEPPDFAIMPSTVELAPGMLLMAVRRRAWIETYRSFDNGESWHLGNQVVLNLGGNPPSMVRMKDGRIALTFGFRTEPYGIRAKISEDLGRTWRPEIVLRDDGGGSDLGYPRTVQRPDGKLVTVYYFNEDAHAERYIGATIWDAD